MSDIANIAARAMKCVVDINSTTAKHGYNASMQLDRCGALFTVYDLNDPDRFDQCRKSEPNDAWVTYVEALTAEVIAKASKTGKEVEA